MSSGQSYREHLLARHRHATSQLDARRRTVLRGEVVSWREILHAIFGPQRRTWRVLGLVWVGLISFHLAFGPERPAASATPPPTAAIAAWLHQLKAYGSLAQIDRRP